MKLKTFARTPSSWDPHDDLLLRRLKEQQKLGWKEISSHFTNRTPNACQFRWRRLRSGSLKNSSSTSLPQQGEDQKLPIQPKTIRRHSLLSTSSTAPLGSSSRSRSGSFTDLQSTNSISSVESAKPRGRSYSTTSSSLLFPHDDPLPRDHIYSSLPQHHLSNNLNHHHHLNPHHLIQKQQLQSIAQHQHLQLQQHQLLQQHQQQLAPLASMWDEDEDDLLLSRRERELSFTELSILLPSKSEMDIWLRIEYLETNRKNSIPQLSRSLSISSSISNQSLVLQSRENSISTNNPAHADFLSSQQQQQQQRPFLIPPVKEEITKKRSIKLPSLGSILNNF